MIRTTSNPSTGHSRMLPLGLGLFMRRRGDSPASIQRAAALFAGLLLIGVALLFATQGV